MSTAAADADDDAAAATVAALKPLFDYKPPPPRPPDPPPESSPDFFLSPSSVSSTSSSKPEIQPGNTFITSLMLTSSAEYLIEAPLLFFFLTVDHLGFFLLDALEARPEGKSADVSSCNVGTRSCGVCNVMYACACPNSVPLR